MMAAEARQAMSSMPQVASMAPVASLDSMQKPVCYLRDSAGGEAGDEAACWTLPQ